MTIDGINGAEKTQIFEQSLSSEDKVTIRAEHEPVKVFQSFFYGNDLINPLEHFFKNPAESVLSSKTMY